jgi:hypothetical protein
MEETISRDLAVKVALDMANRYDEDIEGCDGDELIAYSECISCCMHIAYILRYGKFPSDSYGDLQQQLNFHALNEEAKQLYKEPLQWPI